MDKRKNYTEEEIIFLIENYSIYGVEYCASKLLKTKQSVYLKASKLKLKIIKEPVSKEKLKEISKKYREDNKDKIKEIKKRYCENNRDEINKKARLNKNNREKAKLYQRKVRENRTENDKKIVREYRSSYNKNRRKIDPLYKLISNIRTSISGSFKVRNQRRLSKTTDILGCSFDEFKLYLESKFEAWMNWDNYGKYNGELNHGWDIDHIEPMNNAKTIEDIVRLNCYTNLQPLCSKINRDIKRFNY